MLSSVPPLPSMLMAMPAASSTPAKALFVNWATLVGVEDLGCSVLLQRFPQAVHAKRRVHAIADTPGEYASGVPVDDGHQVHKASCHGQVGGVGAPYLVGAADVHAAQQVRGRPVLGVRPARVRSRCHVRQSYRPHQRLYAFAVHGDASTREEHHAAAAVEGRACIPR